MLKSQIQRFLKTTTSVIAIEETYNATLTNTVELTLDTSTTLIEVSAIDKTIMMKWGTTDASTSDFDEVINLNKTRHFMVPTDITNKKLFTAVNFIEQEAGAILCVVEK